MLDGDVSSEDQYENNTEGATRYQEEQSPNEPQ